MKNVNCRIVTNAAMSEVVCLLKEISSEEGSMIEMMSGKLFFGQITDDMIELITYHQPPLKISGKLVFCENKTEIRLNVCLLQPKSMKVKFFLSVFLSCITASLFYLLMQHQGLWSASVIAAFPCILLLTVLGLRSVFTVTRPDLYKAVRAIKLLVNGRIIA